MGEFLADDGYEFELSKHYTSLVKYKPASINVDTSDYLYWNGYHYTGKNSTIMWEFNERLPITPDNFHRYLNKILNLKAFL